MELGMCMYVGCFCTDRGTPLSSIRIYWSVIGLFKTRLKFVECLDNS